MLETINIGDLFDGIRNLSSKITAQEKFPLKFVSTIPMPGFTGDLDHFAGYSQQSSRDTFNVHGTVLLGNHGTARWLSAHTFSLHENFLGGAPKRQCRRYSLVKYYSLPKSWRCFLGQTI